MIALVLFAVFRFIFTAVMKWVKPRHLLQITAASAAACTLLVIYGRGYVGVYALVSISAFMSLMFPTIYGLGLKGLGNDTKIAGSGLVMAILGGAVLTAIQGQVSDVTQNIHISFYVPFFCFLFIILYSFVEKSLSQFDVNKLEAVV
jgi:FHS family L-fucose permease-like MFS transporter